AYVRHVWRDAWDREGLARVSPHAMRKSFAMAIYEATGKDLRATQLAIGHSSISSTAYYLASCEDHINTTVRGIRFGSHRSTHDDRQEDLFQQTNVVQLERARLLHQG